MLTVCTRIPEKLLLHHSPKEDLYSPYPFNLLPLHNSHTQPASESSVILWCFELVSQTRSCTAVLVAEVLGYRLPFPGSGSSDPDDALPGPPTSSHINATWSILRYEICISQKASECLRRHSHLGKNIIWDTEHTKRKSNCHFRLGKRSSRAVMPRQSPLCSMGSCL